jgi:pilus assembly protein CpaC
MRFAIILTLSATAAVAQTPSTTPAISGTSSAISVRVNRSSVISHGTAIRRVALASPKIADAVVVSAHEIVVNGVSNGDTTLLIWDATGARDTYEIHVFSEDRQLETVRSQLASELGSDFSLSVEGDSVFLKGVAPDLYTAERAVSIAATLGKVVNLLHVKVPVEAPQILLKVKFANVDRSRTNQFGINIFSLNQKGWGNSNTGQFGAAPQFDGASKSVTWTQMLQLFYLRPDLNLAAAIQDLEANNVLEVLAEPNLLTVAGRSASFLAGGEFPFPTLQGGGSGIGQVTIQFKEFGVRLNFLPTITPQGKIHLMVQPEVSSLDYANGLTVSGYTVPGLDSRRVKTEVELVNGQSFVIAGLLDSQVTETLEKMPGLSSIPLLGKLFESRSRLKNNTELLVVVTPELVEPIPSGAPLPSIKMPVATLPGAPAAPQNPVAGNAKLAEKPKVVTVQQMKETTAAEAEAAAAASAAGTDSHPSGESTSSMGGTVAH